jgi:hypothetical protein
MNMVEILFKHTCNGKIRPVPIPGMGREEIKENDGGGEFNYDIQ